MHRSVIKGRRWTTYPSVIGDESGFTLIETILTFVILAMIAVILLASLRLGIRSWEKGENSVEATAAKKSIVVRMTRDVGSMFPYMLREEGAVNYLFSGAQDELSFVTSTHTGGVVTPWGGTKLVYYHTVDATLVLREVTLPPSKERPAESSYELELLKGISRVSFEYMGPEGWMSTWNADANSSLPSAVKATIAYENDSGPLTFIMPVGVAKPEEPGLEPGPGLGMGAL